MILMILRAVFIVIAIGLGLFLSTAENITQGSDATGWAC